MRAAALGQLAGIAAGFAVAGFVALGFSRLAIGYGAARRLAAPLFLVGFAIAAVLFAVGVLWKLGVVEIEE